MITTPDHDTLVDQMSTDMQTRSVGDARVRGSVLWVLVRVLAVVVRAIYQWLTWASRQILPDTADSDYLRRHASMWNITPIPAAQAQGDVTFTGTAGATIAAGTEWQHEDNVVYTVDSLLTIGGGGSVTGAVTAVVAADDGNAIAGVILTAVTPISNVDSEATVAAGGLTGGLDDETDAALRERVLERIRTPPQGGASADYIAWAKEVATVDEVFVNPLESGPGTVAVRFVVEGTGSAVIPSGAKVTEVQAKIDAERPVTASVTVSAPSALAVNLTITLSTDTSAIRAAVEASLESLYQRERAPSGTIKNSRIRDAISTGQRSEDTSGTFTLTDVNGDGTGLSDIVQGAGQVAVHGTVTWL